MCCLPTYQGGIFFFTTTADALMDRTFTLWVVGKAGYGTIIHIPFSSKVAIPAHINSFQDIYCSFGTCNEATLIQFVDNTKLDNFIPN